MGSTMVTRGLGFSVPLPFAAAAAAARARAFASCCSVWAFCSSTAERKIN